MQTSMFFEEAMMLAEQKPRRHGVYGSLSCIGQRTKDQFPSAKDAKFTRKEYQKENAMRIAKKKTHRLKKLIRIFRVFRVTFAPFAQRKFKRFERQTQHALPAHDRQRIAHDQLDHRRKNQHRMPAEIRLCLNRRETSLHR